MMTDLVFSPAQASIPRYQTILAEKVSTHVLKVSLNRPEVSNAFNTLMGQELEDLWNRLILDTQGFRAIVLTASGEKAFCGGGDLKERNGMTREQWTRQHEVFERQYWALLDVPIPVIAAVNGHAYAGGLEMALTCDFIYANKNARFALTEVTLGIMPGAGGTQLLPRAVGERRAKEIIMTGKPFSAQQAYDWGLVNELFEPQDVLQEALKTAETVASNAPLSVRQVKKSVRYGGQMELKTAFRFEIEAYNHLIDTEDRLEGVKAFNEKRKPHFLGK
jgi:enoyl-CoA hydratase/carnithine racemase